MCKKINKYDRNFAEVISLISRNHYQIIAIVCFFPVNRLQNVQEFPVSSPVTSLSR
jgi:hypothetical protein